MNSTICQTYKMYTIYFFFSKNLKLFAAIIPLPPLSKKIKYIHNHIMYYYYSVGRVDNVFL